MTFNQIPNTNCTYEDFIGRYTSFLLKDLKEICPEIEVNEKMLLSDMFDHIYQKQGNGFIFILDEWDYIFNNNLFSENDRKAFLEFLRDLLKDKPYIELAYMTGVLPIAKYSSGSALNMFLKFSVMNDHMYDKYFGFTNEEVESLCQKQDKVSMANLKE